MTTLVVDASIAIKWVVSEVGSQEALALHQGNRLVAPDLLTAECANILWKKVRRGEASKEDADVAARALEHADVELMPMRHLIRSATDIAGRIAHPAYDCFYIALALANDWTFVTADESLTRKIRQQPDAAFASIVETMAEAAAKT